MIGNRLKGLREESNLLQKELADKVNVSAGAIGMYENNKRNPDYETLNKLADCFEVSVDYLLGRTDDPRAAILKGNDLPKEMREVGIEEVAVLKEFREAGLSPEDVKEIIEWYKWKKEKGKS